MKKSSIYDTTLTPDAASCLISGATTWVNMKGAKANQKRKSIKSIAHIIHTELEEFLELLGNGYMQVSTLYVERGEEKRPLPERPTP